MAVLRMLLLFLCMTVISARHTNVTGPSTEGVITCPHGEELKFVIVGSNNATGYPQVQARLEQPAGRELWRLDVALRDAPCPHGETRRVMQVTLHGPTHGEYLPTAQRLTRHPQSQLSEIEIFETTVPLSSNNTASNITWSETLVPSRADEADDFDWQANEVSPQFEGYNKIVGLGRYKHHEEKANWTQASKICHREGATLALPNSQVEADRLWRLKQAGAPMQAEGARGAFGMALAGMLNRAFLVGARRFRNAANFTTIFGEDLHEAGYDTWAVPPEGTEDCVAMYEKIGFFVVACEAELSFICELHL